MLIVRSSMLYQIVEKIITKYNPYILLTCILDDIPYNEIKIPLK